ncbi:hypothetical protein DM860_014888 [Cuscuta australis]|uniref:Uncharacterized protein n=1 Tax=Cuscuta australis TaxID=267555 RepID=A0A328DME3_9ASTE|nr:hypothetical protein DM860_014888 [Cuscuta australis]
MNDIVCNIDMGDVEIQDFGLLNEDNDGDGNETEVEEVGDNNEENTYDVRFDQVLEAEEGLVDVPEFFFEDVEGSDEEDILVEVQTSVVTSVVYPSHTSMKCMHILQPVSKPPKTTKRVAPLNAKKGTASTSRGRIHNSSRSNALTTCLPSTHRG